MLRLSFTVFFLAAACSRADGGRAARAVDATAQPPPDASAEALPDAARATLNPPDGAEPSDPARPAADAVGGAAGDSLAFDDAARDSPGPPSTVSPPHFLVFGGDVLLHERVKGVAQAHAGGRLADGYAWLLRELAPVRRRLAEQGPVRFVVNLETPIATRRATEPSRWPRFDGPPEALIGIREAGVDVVTVANNHALNQGLQGLQETLTAAREAGLLVAGGGDASTARAPLVLSEHDPRVLLLAYRCPAVPRADPEDAATLRTAALDERSTAEVRAAAANADVVIVSVHWNGELRAEPVPEWREWVEKLVAAGASAVVGHGPHVVGPVETVEAGGRAAPVVFSLGNLVSNMGERVFPGFPAESAGDPGSRIATRTEALAVLRVAHAEGAGSAWSIDGLWVVPLWLEDNFPLAASDPGREIFARPLPWCLPDPAAGCFEGADDAWCAGRRDLLVAGRESVLRTLWGETPPPLAPCPAGADPFDPPADWRSPVSLDRLGSK
ncbi:MAG: CapA family protein [Deltaproteobacteria bacterium]|nr:CapA family protein [Deltaproteobacteria bacterium]